MSRENTSTTPTAESNDDLDICRICGGEPICQNMGLVRYDVPLDDPRFGKLFRCPNNPVDLDAERQERLRKLSNLGDFADKGFHNFEINRGSLTPAEATSLEWALRYAADYAENPQGWILLEGPYGCGKTHLAAAIGNLRLQRGDNVLFITVPDLLDHLRAGFQPSSESPYDEAFERIRSASILILDDLGAENNSAWAREKLFQLFNHRYTRRLPTVITTNNDLNTLDARIRSRLLDSSIVGRRTIMAPDYRTSIRNELETASDLDRYENFTFDTFTLHRKLTSPERSTLERVYEVARSFAQSPESSWLYISGPNGSGKTHLAAAIANQLQEQRQVVTFVTVPDLLDYLRIAFNPNVTFTLDQRFQLIRNTPILVLDHFTLEGCSTWAREKLFQIVDYRYVRRLSTIFTTHSKWDEIENRFRIRVADNRLCNIIELPNVSYVDVLRRGTTSK
ncbi:MAG: ATP-binding protein [Anaerolineae bacterium]|nr:ATP-binding protein [Anaerolineae bacterium]